MTRDYQRMADRARAQENKRMKRDDMILIGACLFLALYGGFLYWSQLKPPQKATLPYPNLFVGPVLETIRRDPTLTAHPDGSLYWRYK